MNQVQKANFIENTLTKIMAVVLIIGILLPTAHFFIPSAAVKKHTDDSDLSSYLKTWTAKYMIKDHFELLRGIVFSAERDEKLAEKFGKIINNLHAASALEKNAEKSE